MRKNITRTLSIILCALIVFFLAQVPQIAFAESPTPSKRIAGSDRYETGFQITDEFKSLLGVEKLDAIVVASGVNFPDALSGSCLAADKVAPIILVNPQDVSRTTQYIKSNLQERGVVYILGGEASVPVELETELAEYKVERLAGSDRYETNLQILKEVGVRNTLLICSGKNYADSLAVSSTGYPIMLVGDKLTESQKRFLFIKNLEIIIIGGTGAVNQTVENELSVYDNDIERLAGADRFETARLVAEQFFPDANSAILAFGKNYPDGLCGGPLGYLTQSPILLAAECQEHNADAYAQQLNIESGYVVGGTAVVSERTQNIVFTSMQATGHEYIQDRKEPTCTEAGYDRVICQHCGHSKNKSTLPALGHKQGDLIESVEATTGWAGYDLVRCERCRVHYKINEVPKLNKDQWPKGWKDKTGKITIYREWHKNAFVYAAHLEFTDYKRLSTDCANGKYNSGLETTSAAAGRLRAIFVVNGDYAIPSNGAGGYCVARRGKVWNDRPVWSEGTYNNATGLLTYPSYEGYAGRQLSTVVKEGKVTDTFQFGPAFLLQGKVVGSNGGGRAQRTFIGTNGEPGDIWICVSEGRNADGASPGLTGYECGTYLLSKGCIFGLPLDGGGSSTMYFNGEVLNSASRGQRAVADFLYFK